MEKLKHQNDFYTQEQGVSLKEYLEVKIAAVENKTEVTFESVEKAVAIASTTLELRLESMNEFRAQLTSQVQTFLPRSEYVIQYQNLSDRVDMSISSASEKHEDLKNCMNDDIKKLEKRVQGVELLRAEITGKIWTLGVVISILIVVFEVIARYVIK